MRQPVILFTQTGYAELADKLAKLRLKREEVLPRLVRAREMGDLSENGAYKAARFELSDTDRAIRQVERLIKYGRAVAPKADGTVGIGNKATLKKADGKVVTYEIVGTYEADPLRGKISIESPVGQELLGKKTGEVVREMVVSLVI